MLRDRRLSFKLKVCETSYMVDMVKLNYYTALPKISKYDENLFEIIWANHI